VGEVVAALVAEAARRLPECADPPRTLYLGGGTPGSLPPCTLEQVFAGSRKSRVFRAPGGVTLEANPATFDLRKARLFAACGVTRVSLGIQSFAPHVLAVLGREHSPEQARESVAILRDAGIPEINIDLMFSIPGQSEPDWRETLEQALALRPDHISAYNLTYEEDTAFIESLRRGELRANEDHDATFFQLADTLLTAAGYDHYETSNYARPGRRSSHNRGYWRGEAYLVLGPSRVSTSKGVRHANVADTSRYVAMIQALGLAVVESEALTPEARRIERIALGLRTADGIDLSLLEPQALTKAQQLAAEGLARIAGNRLVLVHHGRALVDPIAAELI